MKKNLIILGIILLCAILFINGCAFLAPNTTQTNNPKYVVPVHRPIDKTVEDSVLMALKRDPTLATANITVKSSYGKVTLTGTVPSQDLKNKAQEITARVQGVKEVINELIVQ